MITQHTVPWVAPDLGRGKLSATEARDLLVECFVHAQMETVARAKARKGHASDDATIRHTIEGAVRGAFQSCGGDYDRPTTPALQAVTEQLAVLAAGVGTPRDVIDHHLVQMRKVLQAAEA